MMYLKSNEDRAKYAIIMIWVMTVLEVALLVSNLMQYNLLISTTNGETLLPGVAEANDTRQTIIGIVYLIGFVFSGVTFIQWFRRAYFNLHQRMDNLSYGEGWAAGAWFVPIVNWLRPYQIMKELFIQTKKILDNHGLLGNHTLSLDLLRVWWLFWVSNGVLGYVELKWSRNANSIDELIDVTILGLIGNVISIPLAFLAVKVVKSYSKVEPLLNDIPEDTDAPNLTQHIVQE